MTTIDTARLRALAEAASPGPWEVVSNRYGYDVSETWAVEPVAPSAHNICHVTVGQRDAAYIAAADPPTMLALLDRLAELEGREPEWEYAVRWVQTEGQPVTDIGADREDIDALVLSQDGYAEAVRRKAGEWEPVTGDDDA